MAKIGLALGGGAARGWAHIGVIKALKAAGIEPDVIAGTSIGAVVGGCHVAGKLPEIETFARSMTPRRVFGYFDFNLAGSGLINGQRLSDALAEQLGDTRMEDLDRPFTAVATEIGTGHEVWLSRGRMVEAIRASYAIPGIFKPVKLKDRWLFDGALVNPIPVSVCRALGARYVIAVNLNADLFTLGTVLTDVEAMTEAAPEIETLKAEAGKKRGALQVVQRQFFGLAGRADASVPSLSTIMVDAFNIVHDRIARSRLAGDPPDILINPKLRNFGLFDFHRADELIRVGEQAALRALAELREDAHALESGRPADQGTQAVDQTIAAEGAEVLRSASREPR
ncbi:MAG: patatin-like phospholipase family protein [Hyphomicrobiaceae bacterium]